MIQRHPSRTDTARRERLAESTLDLLAFDTQNPPGGTAELLAWLEGDILEWGVDTEWIETVDGKPNLVATIPGDSEWTLLYEGHVDTVPHEADAWEYDPLGERIDNRLYGRGATDMKGAVAAMVETLRVFAVDDEKPPVTLQFAFVSDEETGGEAGIDTLLEGNWPPLFCIAIYSICVPVAPSFWALGGSSR